jgi:pimeloyl-ACP methyl ester carboxylesterase
MEDYLLDDPKLVSGHTKIDYDTSTNVPVIDTVGRPTEIVIYVHGFQNDEQSAVENFNAVKESFRKNNYDIPVVGFSWDSDVGILNFNDAKIIANMNGPKLANAIMDIKDESPSTKIKLIGHSLGSRVILQTLQTLHNDDWNYKIESVHLLGAAVDSDVVGLNQTYGEAIESVVTIFHNKHNYKDNTLKVYYFNFEGNQALGQIGAGNAILLPENYCEEDVTNEVGTDHFGYIIHTADKDVSDPENDGIIDNIVNDWNHHSDKCNANIPPWIKNNAGWWASGSIDDNSFIQGMEFLIKERIISISNTSKAANHENFDNIPEWVKNNAGWWSQGLISDGDFVKGVQFMVENGIIHVSSSLMENSSEINSNDDYNENMNFTSLMQ